MRLVCMVPSLTETLIECGFDVVGRTRYCLYPQEKVGGIAVVGGTKDISWEKVKALNPDLLIFDREENPKRFAEQCPFKWWATGVEDLQSVPRDLQKLYDFLRLRMNAKDLPMQKLKSLIEEWHRVILKENEQKFSWTNFPGLIEWWKTPEENWQPEQILYLIWRNPWMTVSRDTFIGSVLNYVGYQLPVFEQKYPKIDLEQYDIKKTLVLYSSEPYLFAKDKEELKDLGFASALVDGEKFSWFGVRSLRFLVSENK